MVEIDLCDGWAPWPRFECDPWTNWMRPAPTRMIEWCLRDTAAATTLQGSVDLNRFLERTASGDWFRRDSRRADGKQQPAWCLSKTQDKFAVASMAKKLLHCCTHRPSIKGSKLLFPVIKAIKIKLARMHDGACAFFVESMHAFQEVLWAPCTCTCVR